MPASTANLGPGFDIWGIALDLRNDFICDRADRKDGSIKLSFLSGDQTVVAPASLPRKVENDNRVVRAYNYLLKKAGQTPKRVVRELRGAADWVAKFEVGQTLPLADIFQVGQFVDAQGITRGRGFTGVMRRWNFAGNVNTHGTHEYRRHGGSIGTNMTPGRTLPGLKMGGQYGNETVTAHNLKVAKILPEDNLLLIEGAIPGAKNGIVLVRGAVKKRGGVKKA